MTNNQTTPAEIARRLSKEQKRALLWLGIERNDFEQFPPGMEVVALSMTEISKGDRLIRCINQGDCIEYRLTPLGTQVRAMLEQGGGK